MADDKNKQDGRDRERVAGNEEYELDYVAQKYGVTRDEVRDAITKVGNGREAIDKYFSGQSTD